MKIFPVIPPAVADTSITTTAVLNITVLDAAQHKSVKEPVTNPNVPDKTPTPELCLEQSQHANLDLLRRFSTSPGTLTSAPTCILVSSAPALLTELMIQTFKYDPLL